MFERLTSLFNGRSLPSAVRVVASWDDGAAADVRVAELMAKYDIPTIFYWPYNLATSLNVTRVKRFLTLSQCVELAQNFEVGSHTISHPHLTKIRPAEARREILESRKMWQDVTGQPVESFCYPRGYANEEIRQMVADAGYRQARNVAVGHLTAAEDPYWTGATVHVGIDRVEYNGVPWAKYARNMLRTARRTEDATYHLFGHSWEIERDNNWAELESLLRDLTS